LRLQEPFCATPEISHIFPYEWDFPVGGTPTHSSPSQTDGIPRWKQTLALIFSLGTLHGDLFPLLATEVACTVK